MIYAGIGSRKATPDVLQYIFNTAKYLAENGAKTRTGACIGPDQSFAMGAIAGGGEVTLCLPWDNYEREWVNSVRNKVEIIVLSEALHPQAFTSVEIYHPNPGALSRGARSLHARNYLILDPCTNVICWTFGGTANGGTGQAMRIAEDRKIPITNLWHIINSQQIVQEPAIPKVIGRFDGEYRWLSNFYLCMIVYDNIMYNSVENFYQAMKASPTAIMEIMVRVGNEYVPKLVYTRKHMATIPPAQAKKIGNKITLPSNWNQIKVEVMRIGLIEKFKIPELRAKLLATGNAYLEEGNTWHDNFWGVCSCNKCIVSRMQQTILVGKNLIKSNMLGKLLMEIRDKIRNNQL